MMIVLIMRQHISVRFVKHNLYIDDLKKAPYCCGVLLISLVQI